MVNYTNALSNDRTLNDYVPFFSFPSTPCFVWPVNAEHQSRSAAGTMITATTIGEQREIQKINPM